MDAPGRWGTLPLPGELIFYFYWFNGRRLLEAPLEALLADRGVDLPFCLMWANENWSRRWDGSDHEVLISQDYRTRDEPALIAEFARHFADPRYIRLGGRPVLMVYRAQLIPDTAATVDRWRRLFRTAHGEDPLFIMAQSFGEHDPRPAGMDAAVEFPPHKLTSRTPMITDTLHVLDPAFDAEAYDYAAIARASVEEPRPDYPLIKTAAPGWDNDPRRQGKGTVLHGATPALYQAWLEDLIGFARRNPIEGEAVVCINAWNEWAEGATLEPDVHWGAAFLNATGRAAAGLPAPGARTRILLVGHDGLVHGAQTLLLRLGRALRANHGVDVAFLLLAGGPLEAECRAVAPTVVAGGPDQLDALVRSARAAGCTAAIVNTAASAGMAAVLERHQVPSVLLVHELPRLLREKGLIGALREGMASARTVVFPAELVRDRCLQALGTAAAHTAILPQGVEARLPRRGRATRCGPSCTCRRTASWRSGWATPTCARALTCSCTCGGPCGTRARRSASPGRAASTRRPSRISAPRSRRPRPPARSASWASATTRRTCSPPPTCSSVLCSTRHHTTIV